MAKIVNESVNSSMQIVREMIKISNNSQITNQAANILADKLTPEEFKVIQDWLFIARREKTQKTQKTGGWGDPSFRRI